MWSIDRSESKGSEVTSSALKLIMVFIYQSLNALNAMSLEDIRLIANVTWIFHESDFLILFMISSNYGLILLLRFSSIDNALFLSPFLSYSAKLLLWKIKTLTGLQLIFHFF